MARLRGRRLVALRLLRQVHPQGALGPGGIASGGQETLRGSVVRHGVVWHLAKGDRQRRIQVAPLAAIGVDGCEHRVSVHPVRI